MKYVCEQLDKYKLYSDNYEIQQELTMSKKYYFYNENIYFG